MALIPFAVLWLAYQFGWYGVTTIMGYCGIGFTDLMFPGKEAQVDQVLQQGKGANCGDINTPQGPPIGTPPPASGVQNCPPGMIWVGSAANGGCVQGGTA